MPPIRRLAPYGCALAATASAYGASRMFPTVAPTSLYLAAIVVAARWWGLWPATAATFAALGLLDWFVYEPGVFGPTKEYFVDGLTFLLVAALVGRTYDVLLRNERELRERSEALGEQVIALTETKAALTHASRELAEQNARLTAEEQRFRNLAETVPAKVWVTDDSRECVWVNRRWRDFTGQSLEDARGFGWMDTVHPDDQERCAAVYREAFDGREPFRVDFRVRRADGEYRWLESSGAPWFSDAGHFLGYVGGAMDVTLRYEAEARIKELTEAKSNFLAVMSHELRTPLTAIIGFAALLLEGLPAPLPDACRPDVERIKNSGEDLLRLIDAVLDFNTLETARSTVTFAPVVVDDAVHDVQTVLQPYARKRGLSVATDTTYAPRLLTTDSVKLRQALLNLVSNALKFTKQGVIVIRVHEEEDSVAFEVTDPGCGIPEEDRERIFEPFFQARQAMVREAGGMGLGLAAVRRIAALLGGDVVVRSQVGVGSTFTLTLPK